MFKGGSEEKSNEYGVIQVRSFEDDADTFAYPLHASGISDQYMEAIRFLWFVQNGLPATDHDHDYDDFTSIARYLTVTYATWAYTRMFLTPAGVKTVNVSDLARRLYQDYENAFG